MMLPFLALTAVQAPPPAPPVILEHFGPGLAGEALTTWKAGEARCGGEPVRAERLETPYASVDWMPPTVTASTSTLRFRIDADGRPIGIVPSVTYGTFSDLAPALAASRFATGQARTDCVIDYTGTRTRIGDASLDALIGYTIFPLGRPSRAVWERVRPVGTCTEPPPALRNRAYPDFEAIPQAAGTTSWSMIGYALDAKGRPVRAHVVTGTGNVALDRASLQAVKDSRFAPGARTGCMYPYWRRGPVLSAPAPVDKDALRPKGATCPASIDWARQPVLSYPEPFRRRGIEGWAVIGFDLAPWGATGNVRVLAAEPAAAFGEQAVGIIRAASATRSTTGYIGCVERVRFAMGVPGGRGQVPEGEAPPPF